LLLVAFLLVTAPNCHLSLVLASAVQGDAVNCNTGAPNTALKSMLLLVWCKFSFHNHQLPHGA